MSEPGIVEGFEQPFTIKNQNTQLNKKTCPLLVKPIMDKKKCPYGFPGIYIYISVCVSLRSIQVKFDGKMCAHVKMRARVYPCVAQ